jgi:tetrahydromethanopterin S-methyltransferase subunit D
MKKVLTASVVALIAATGAASAMATATGANETLIKRYAPEADLSGVSDATIIHVLATINDDGDDSFVQTQSQVRALLK